MDRRSHGHMFREPVIGKVCRGLCHALASKLRITLISVGFGPGYTAYVGLGLQELV